jgi:DNA integrity scanning protein DisA with diadenylate cyclase activity
METSCFFDAGTLRLTYRRGRWQYWNHTYVIKIMETIARRQRVQRTTLAKVIPNIYRHCLDLSFRRTGGLFLILSNASDLHRVVRRGDALRDRDVLGSDYSFEGFLHGERLQNLSRSVVAELASLDGAIVLTNGGEMLAYNAVLQPTKRRGMERQEGARSKAAAGASNYGLVAKVSSDGNISVFYDGTEVLEI